MQFVNVHIILEDGAKTRLVGDGTDAPMLLYGESIITAQSPQAARDLIAGLTALAGGEPQVPAGEAVIASDPGKAALAELVAALSDDEALTNVIYSGLTPRASIARIRAAVSEAERVLGY